MSQGCSERFIKDAKRIVTLWKRYESDQHVENLTLEKCASEYVKLLEMSHNVNES